MIKKIYAEACIKDGKNFFTVPKSLQDAVREIIESRGYYIMEDGTVVPHVDVEPQEESEEAEE